MTGGWSSELVKHCHFRIFDKNNELFFRDVRKFGNLKIIDNDLYLIKNLILHMTYFRKYYTTAFRFLMTVKEKQKSQ